MLYQAAVFIHVLSAVIWVGGTLFLVIVMVPLARKDMRQSGPGFILLRQATRRFLPVAWASIVLLALTGAFIAWDHWGVRPGNFFSTGGHFFRTLQVKTGLVILVIGLSLVHDFILGPRVLSQLERNPSLGKPAGPSRARRLLLTMARVNVVLMLAILALAVALIRP